MTKTLVSIAALAALASAAVAGQYDGNGGNNRNYDLRESDTYRGKYSVYDLQQTYDEAPLAIVKPSYIDREQRRLDEKNGSGGSGY